MTAAVIDLVTRRRVFARFVASASAAAAKAVAEGRAVAVWDGGRLHRQYPDGRRECVQLEIGDDAAEKP